MKLKTWHSRILLMLVFFLFNASNFALSATSYLGSIDEAIEIALQNSGELKTETAKIQIAKSQVEIAKSRLNPSFITDNSFAEDTYRTGVEFVVETANKRKKRTEIAQIQEEIVQEEINAKILDIRTKVRHAYVALYSAQEKEKAAYEILQTIETLLDATKKKYEAGSIAQIDLTQVEIMQTNAKNDLECAKNEINRSYNELNLLLGFSLASDCRVEKPAFENYFKDLLSLDEEGHKKNIEFLEEQAYKFRNELKIDQNNIVLAQKQLGLAKANRVPNLSLSGGVGVVRGDNAKTSGFVMGGFDIPIFDRQKGQIQEAVALENQYRTQYEYEKSKISVEVKDAYNNLVTSTKLVANYENELLPKARDIAYKSRRRFEEGKDGIIVPLFAQQAEMQTKFNYIQVLNDYQNALSSLERAVGKSLGTFL